MKFIFIAGASASGKTTLAVKLEQQLISHGFSCHVISMDDYSMEAPVDIGDIDAYRRDTNFDRVEMYDLPLLRAHVTALNSGIPIQKPIFEFASNRRVGNDLIEPPDFIIIEGLFALYFAKTFEADALDKTTVFVGKSSYHGIIQARILRDVNNRGFQVEDVVKKERRDVGPSFFQIIAKSKSGVDFDISNDEVIETHHPLDAACDEICQFLCPQISLSSLIP